MRFAALVLTLSAVLTAAAQGLRQSRPGMLSRARQQPAAPAAAAAAGDEEPSDINWVGTELDLVLDAYGKRVEKTVLKDPACPTVQITLKSRPGQKLSDEEWKEAVETILEMNQIHLEPYGEAFIRALPRKDVRKEGIPLIMDTESRLRESTRVVSLMIPFKNIAIDEAQKALEGLKSNSGILLVFERTNSILVTDTEQNINRMLEIAKMIDVASPVTEVVEYIQIKYASATEVKQVIDNIVQEAMKEQEKNGKQVNAQQSQNRPSQPLASTLLRRPGQQAQPSAPANNESLVMTVSDADRGMIRGKVVTIADERSNKILIITNASNMKFFKDVIAALDVETTPDTVVKVYRLKYAEAEDVSDMINDLIGNAPSSKGNSKGNQNQNAKNGQSGSVTKSTTQPAKKSANQRTGEAKAGELSKENTTVLADKRINGLVVMTMKELVPVVEDIIEAMDVKLSQVLIETMILQVTLSDQINTGIDWVSGLANNTGHDVIQGLSGGGKTTSIGDTGTLNFSPGTGEKLIAPGAAGISYYAASKALNLGAIMKAAKSDSRAKLVASPIIMTVDNKEATIECTKMRYLLKGYTYSGSTYNGSAVPDYEQKEIGLTAKVTPKINPNGTVMLTVEEEFSSLGDSQTIQAATGGTTVTNGSTQQAISGIQVETTVTRKLSADITVDNRKTVILGGLSQTETSQEENGIPILKDIPFIGRYLFGSTKDVETRQELLMFLTPYVLDDTDSAVAEARRRKQTLSDSRPWDDHGWSSSTLAEPVSFKEQLRRKQREWLNEDEDLRSRRRIEDEKEKRVDKLIERDEEEAERREQRAKDAAKRREREAKALADKYNALEDQKEKERLRREEKDREAVADLIENQKLKDEPGVEPAKDEAAKQDPKGK